MVVACVTAGLAVLQGPWDSAGAVGLIWSAACADNTAAAMLALTLATMGIITTISQFWLLPPAILTGTAAAAGIALANSIGSVSGMIAPCMLGVVKTMTNSTNAGAIAIACCLLVGCVLVFTVPAKAVNRN